MKPISFTKRASAIAGVVGLVASGVLAVALVAASPAAALPGPAAVAEPGPNNVTADALPTVQIDGVVWSQAVVGNTVYAGGSFSNARPAGAAPGTSLTPRANLLAYNLTTGALITSFAPTLNGLVKSVVASPDGSRIYVGGAFTSVSGNTRSRVAAFSTATGALITTFKPVMSTTVNAITATNSTVYVGGVFTTANGVARSRLAAFNASDGSLTAWNPNADTTVNAMVATPDGSRIIVGGPFQHIGGQGQYGLAAVDAVTGGVVPWAANQIILDAGSQAAILSLSTDGTAIYGTGYVFGAGGNFEGTFSADPNSGAINWIEDCHGDTYGAFGTNGVVYTVSHAHYCSTVGGYPQSDSNWAINMRHALAFTATAQGTLAHNGYGGYADWFGNPAPAMYNWFPDFTVGTFTGQSQAAWSVTGNSQYVVMGGEFPSVNGTKQQGLVRFATKPPAPGTDRPRLSGPNFVPSVAAISTHTARVAWQANWDRDNENLTYQVIRNNNAGAPVYTTTYTSQYWNRPTLGFVDSGLSPGVTYNYKVYASDADGNVAQGSNTSITMPTQDPSPYVQDVLNDGAIDYWRLGEPSGTTGGDLAGFNNLVEGTGVGHGAAGALSGDTNTASTFDGTDNGNAGATNSIAGPNTFTVETWIKTTSTQGGKIVGFGNAQSGASSGYDRHVYMDNAGHLIFGVYPNAVRTVSTSGTYNDGQYHYIVATLSGAGMVLYVDGKQVARDTGTTVGQDYAGYWRVGGDNLNAWPSLPSSFDFAGTIDDTSIYPTALSAVQVRQHYIDSGRTLNIPPAPTDPYGQRVYADNPDLYWRLDDASGPTAADTSPNESPGIYTGGVSYHTPSPVTGSSGTGATFDGVNGGLASQQAYTGPNVYSEALWFKTTTTHGGKLIGFGNHQSGLSDNYDRHVYMLDSGQLEFGVWTGQANLATSPAAYNDGNWHQLVATQGSDGMILYVDGHSVAANPQSQAQDYTGYWKVGGDVVWSGDGPYFAGSIDEVAVYLSELTPNQVLAQYNASPSVTPVPNQDPVAAFTSSCTNLSCSFDGSTSHDDGSIASYAWDFGDSGTATGATPAVHTFTAGTHQVTLTVTDNLGATDSVTHPVTVSAANQDPVAAFTSSCTNLSCSFNGSTSHDDGSIASYAWDFGDSGTATGATPPAHAYVTPGTHQVTLTVTDNLGATNSVTHPVTVSAANQNPVAAFTSSCTNLTCSFNGSTSSDPDGSVASYAWDFGDAGTATGATPAAHTYGTGGTYQVTLTVTDNQGGTNSIVHAVTVAPAAGVFAADAFNRTANSSWGTADTGGAWTVAGMTAANFSVSAGLGRMKMTAVGSTPTAYLNSTPLTNADSLVDFTFDKAQTGSSYTYAYLAARHTGTSQYRLRTKVLGTGTIQLSITKVVSNVETVLLTKTITGLTFTPGQFLRMRLRVSGTSSVALSGKLWAVGSTEPASWQVTATDASAPLGAGASGVTAYLASLSTNAPVTAQFAHFSVGPIAGP